MSKTMTATMRTSCPLCGDAIKKGETIVLDGGKAAVCELCHHRATQPAASIPNYISDPAAYRTRSEELAAAYAALPVKVAATQGRERGELGSFGGSQIAEDMGDFSGKH